MNLPATPPAQSGSKFWKEQRQCRCGQSYEASGWLWDGEPIAPLDESCAECQAMEKCSPFHIPQKRKRTRPKVDRVESTWMSQELFTRVPAVYKDLCTLACNGDDLALRILVDNTKRAVWLLQQIAWSDPKRLIPLAEQDIVWPAAISNKRAGRELNDRLLKLLKVGTKSRHNGPWHPNSPATQVAGIMDFWLQGNQQHLGLPNFTKATAGDWFKTGWKALLRETGGAPEQHPFLKPIGQAAIDKTDKKAVRRGMPKQTKGMLRDDMRAKIKENIRRSFYSINGVHI